MGHQTDTPAENPEVSRQTHLQRRGSVYYFRAKLPADLRKAKAMEGKKELKWSLKTSDPKQAAARINKERIKAEALFEAERNRIKPAPPVITARVRVRTHPLKLRSEAHAQELARNWFIELERASVAEMQSSWANLNEAKKSGVLEDLWYRQADITGEESAQSAGVDDGTPYIKQFLTQNRLTLDKDSAEYTLLRGALLQAQLEHLRRTQDRLKGLPFRCYDPLFQEVFGHSSVKPKTKAITVGELGRQFIADQKRAKLAPKTLFAYSVHIRLLQDILGEGTPIHEIQRPEVERLCDLLERLPSNATKRYPGKSPAKAIEEADRKNDPHRLAMNTLRNYFFNMFSIFDYALQTELISKNPFDDHWFKGRFTPKEEDGENEDDTVEFTVDELNKIFRAPLYTGCKDDERGYAKPGLNVIRRGRFWVPLIGLYQGFRLNEICQLYTQDLKEEDGELVFEVRVKLETKERATDKRIKRPASRRTVPVHPDLFKMGFLDYVEQRRRDTESPRLFPELHIAKKTGSYSDVFSKWFTNFLVQSLRHKPEATFHSFRHGWRSALFDAEVSDERVKVLGGWARQGQSAKYGRAKHVQALKQEISKVTYPGLDLSHLYL